MSGSHPTSVPPWTGLAFVILVVGLVAFGAAGGAAALPAETADVGDAIDTGENATEDSTDTVEETTAGGDAEPVEGTTSVITEGSDSTADTVESETERAVNTTAETVAETTTSTADTVDISSGLSTDGLSDQLQSSPDANVVLSSASGPRSSVGASSGSHDRAMNGATMSASSPSRAFPVTESTDAGGNDPTSPLSRGEVAFAGIVVGSVAARRALVFAEAFRGAGTTRSARRAVAARFETPWPDRFWRVLGAFGYQRFDDSDPLEHDTRAAIYRLIEETEGAYLSEISRATSIPLSTVRYHLRILEHESVVTPTKMRGKQFYFPADSEPSALRAALIDEGSAAVLRALARHGPDSVSGLAATLGRDVSTVSHHLQQLADAGLVHRERNGRTVVNRLAPAVQDALGDRTDSSEFDDGSRPLEKPAS